MEDAADSAASRRQKNEPCDTLAGTLSPPQDTEEVMDQMAKQYVDSIEPDLALVVKGKGEKSSLPRTGPSAESTSHSDFIQPLASPDDTCIVPVLPPGPLASLFPPGTRVRRPKGQLPELVEEAIRNSPHGALRVPHVYAALQNRYPYFRFMTEKAITTWKSSVRHTLINKKRFEKRPASTTRGSSAASNQFWALCTDPNLPPERDLPAAPQFQQAAVIHDSQDAPEDVSPPLQLSSRTQKPQEPEAGPSSRMPSYVLPFNKDDVGGTDIEITTLSALPLFQGTSESEPNIVQQELQHPGDREAKQDQAGRFSPSMFLNEYKRTPVTESSGHIPEPDESEGPNQSNQSGNDLEMEAEGGGDLEDPIAPLPLDCSRQLAQDPARSPPSGGMQL